MVPILVNEDVFVPSYNDFKFWVQSRNYLFTNLILVIYTGIIALALLT